MTPSPYINHFIQPDNIIPNPADPQSWNRYSYVQNNPIRFNDPSGHYQLDAQCTDPNLCVLRSKTGGSDPKDMITSKEGKDFIKFFESGKEPPAEYPYPDMGGTCTIGWGHALPNDKEECKGWPNQWYGEHPLSVQGAEEFFENDIEIFENLIRTTIIVDLTQGQFDALVSYTFNSGDQLGHPYFKKGMPSLINSGNFEVVAMAIAAGPITSGDPPIESPQLVERRRAETNMFLYGIYGNYVPWKP